MSDPVAERALCADCVHYDTRSEDGGACRRRAPTVMRYGEDAFAYTCWPRVRAWDWCGEWATSSRHTIPVRQVKVTIDPDVLSSASHPLVEPSKEDQP